MKHSLVPATGPGKLSSADRSGDQESRGLVAPQLPEDSISETLVSGTLVFISVIIAVLIHDIRHDNELTREPFGTEAELEQTQLPFVSLQSYPSALDHALPALSTQKTSSPPPQIAAPSPTSAFNREIIGIAPGLPGANLFAGERQFLRSQQIGLRKSAAVQAIQC
jgi:hypothetical protein